MNMLQSITRKLLNNVAGFQRSTCSVVWPPFIPELCVYNEPNLSYRAKSCERASLKCNLKCDLKICEEIPIVIGNEYIYDGKPKYQVVPHDHGTNIAKFYHASEETISKAINLLTYNQCFWDQTPLEDRIYVWHYAAELLSSCYRQSINAATMLGQGKTVMEAELDICELIDLFRYNAFYLKECTMIQPAADNWREVLNSMRFRGIDGFVAAVTSFNLTSVAANIAYTPVLMGNCTLWKPNDSAILSNWRVFNALRAAGLPAGVVNFVPSDNYTFAKAVTQSPNLAGLNYAGPNHIFDWYWKIIGKRLKEKPKSYINYPRIVGDCGGNSYHFVHESADVETVVACTIRSAFEYSGQKPSSCKRLYIPRCLHKVIIHDLKQAIRKLKVGKVQDFKMFTGAVIDKKTFKSVTKYIDHAVKNKRNKVLIGGKYDQKTGYFIDLTIIETFEPRDKLLTDVIMGPVLTIFTYDEKFPLQALANVKMNSKCAMAGSIFGTDCCFLFNALNELRDTAGSLYINDKSTSIIIGHQLFGGGHKSGTNDKVGGPNYLLRWTSPQTIKEKFVNTPITDIAYPYMAHECEKETK